MHSPHRTPTIHGVTLLRPPTHERDSGELTEIFSAAWGIGPAPLPHVFQASIRPGRIKGWAYHAHQTDRIFVLSGFLKIVLWDARPDSPTRDQVEEFHLSERNRGVLVIPPGVVHALHNLGRSDAITINFPTRAYDHTDPDIHRVDAADVPYTFTHPDR